MPRIQKCMLLGGEMVCLDTLTDAGLFQNILRIKSLKHFKICGFDFEGMEVAQAFCDGLAESCITSFSAANTIFAAEADTMIASALTSLHLEELHYAVSDEGPDLFDALSHHMRYAKSLKKLLLGQYNYPLDSAVAAEVHL
jgi:hypothetical protein